MPLFLIHAPDTPLQPFLHIMYKTLTLIQFWLMEIDLNIQDTVW